MISHEDALRLAERSAATCESVPAGMGNLQLAELILEVQRKTAARAVELCEGLADSYGGAWEHAAGARTAARAVGREFGLETKRG